MRRARAGLVMCMVAIATACSDSSDSLEKLAPLSDRYEFSSEDSVPEGVAFDPQGRAFYATSLQGGSIIRINAAGEESVFRAADNRAQLLGAKVDAQRRRLWVCARGVDGVDNRVWVFNLDSGQQVMEFLLGALVTDGSCNDLVLDSAGMAYVTDPVNPYLYRLDPATGTGSKLATDPLFNDTTGLGLGLNGIALTPDESALIVAGYAPASLLRVSLPDADHIETLALTGDTLPAPDGLAVLEGHLYAVSNDSVSRIRPNADFSAGDVVTVTQRSGLSTAAVAESELYVIKSEVLNFVLNRTLNTPFEIFRVETDAF